MAEANYRAVSQANPQWGELAVLPWDSEIFGFPVADYRVAEVAAFSHEATAIARALQNWAAENEVELIGCSVSALEKQWRAVLPRVGFLYVDSTFTYTITRPTGAKFPRPLPAPWLATREHQPLIEAIAERAFNVGRYHADPFFPVELANRRYRRWLANTFDELSDASRIYVIGEPDAPTGFTTAKIEGAFARLPFGATDPSVHGTPAGYALFLGLVDDLRRAGVRRVQSKLSAGNTPMINLAAFGGARFSDPQLVYHWHAANAPHLAPRRLVE